MYVTPQPKILVPHVRPPGAVALEPRTYTVRTHFAGSGVVTELII